MQRIGFVPEQASSNYGYSSNYSTNHGGMYSSAGNDLYQRNSHTNNYRHKHDGDDDKAKAQKGPRAYSMKNHQLPNVNSNILIWLGFAMASLLIYFLVSGGDFSFLLTFAGMTRMFGFGILNTKIFGKGATGVSTKTLGLYAVVFACRLTSIMRHEGYLPYDKSGDWLYHVIEGMSLLFSVSALFACVTRGVASMDTFGGKGPVGALTLAVPMLIVAVFIHPNLNSDFLSDAAWTYAMYLESVALVPQLTMFQQNKQQAVEWLTAHFVAALGFGRVLELGFWVWTYQELTTKAGSKMPGYVAMLAQSLQLLLLLNFFRHYYQAVKNKAPLILPSTNEVGLGMV